MRYLLLTIFLIVFALPSWGEVNSKSEIFEFESIKFNAKSNGKWVTIYIIFQDVTSNNNTSSRENFIIGLDGNMEIGQFHAVRLDKNSFEIPTHLSFPSHPGSFFIDMDTIEDGTFHKLYDFLPASKKMKLDGACSFLNNNQVIENMLETIKNHKWTKGKMKVFFEKYDPLNNIKTLFNDCSNHKKFYERLKHQKLIETNKDNNSSLNKISSIKIKAKKEYKTIHQKIENRRTINVFRAWDTPDTFGDVNKYYYGLYWTVNPNAPNYTIKLSQINWNFNYPRFDYDNYEGINNYIIKKQWQHEEEYGETDTVKFWDDKFPEFISNVSLNLVEEYSTDGVILDWWRDEGGILKTTGLNSNQVKKARTEIARKLRRKLGNDSIILGNVGWDLNNTTTEYISGVFLELHKKSGKYSLSDIKKMEDSLYFYDQNLQEPKIIAMAPWKVSKSKTYNINLSKNNESIYLPDSDLNIKYAKLFTAMAMVVPKNGYILYSYNNWDIEDGFDYQHLYYDFYNIDLGKPTSNVIKFSEGVAYKKFQKGLIAYNRTASKKNFKLDEKFEINIDGLTGVFCEIEKESLNCL